MSLFDKFCQGKDIDPAPSPVETALPNQFDQGRRTSVSAECWMQACDIYQCGQQSSRLPLKKGAHPTAAAGAAATPTSSAQVPGSSPGSLSSSASPLATPATQINPGEGATATATLTASDSQPSPALGSRSTMPYLILGEDKETVDRIASALRNTIFFKELGDDLMNQVLRALVLKKVDANTVVIKQGDEGDELFVLDKGSVEYEVDGQRVGEAVGGSTFGELALLYNSPRAATVRTLEPSTMYTLDRITFKRIMVAKLSRKRVHSQQVLASIDIFASLPEATQLRIADALHPTTYHKDEIVIKQGDSGKDFFLIDEGTVEVSIDGKIVTELDGGSYFGEIALIYDLPRAATVKVTSEKLKVEVLSSVGFERLIGPELVAELRKRDPRQ